MPWLRLPSHSLEGMDLCRIKASYDFFFSLFPFRCMQETEAAENERVGWRHSLSALGQSATRVKSRKVHLELNPCMYSLDPPILIQAIPHSRVNEMGGGICNPTPMWQRRYLPLHLSSIVAQYCLPVTPFFQSESDCQTSPECLYKELEVCPSVDFFFSISITLKHLTTTSKTASISNNRLLLF